MNHANSFFHGLDTARPWPLEEWKPSIEIMQQLVSTTRHYAKAGQIHANFRDNRYDFLLFIGRIASRCLPDLYTRIYTLYAILFRYRLLRYIFMMISVELPYR